MTDTIKTTLPPYILAVDQATRSTRGYCNCAAAAKYLHCSTQTIWRMVKRGIIPQHRVSGEAAPRYSYDELDSILEANTKRGE